MNRMQTYMYMHLYMYMYKYDFAQTLWLHATWSHYMLWFLTTLYIHVVN